jgi:hypothetical protein
MTAATADLGPSVVAKMRAAAESLVVRARAGDQNAIAMISRIRESVPRSRRAAAAYEHLREYVAKHPVAEAGFGSVLSRLDTPSAMRSVATAANRGDGYGGLVRAVERLPTKTVSYTRAACLVADGRNVDEAAVRAVLPMLRGDAVIQDGKGVSLGAAHRAGHKVAQEWDVTLEGGNLRIKPVDGFELAFEVKGKPVSSAWLFRTAFNRALWTEDVLLIAEPLSDAARQPVRVGYVLGLAYSIQGVTRRGRRIGDLSEVAGWELGE